MNSKWASRCRYIERAGTWHDRHRIGDSLGVRAPWLGILVGLGAGVVVRQAYRDNGLSTMSIPWLQLLGFLGAAILVGLIASISPASRALKKPVLEAVASD